jgi:hypothetical protein
LFTDGTPPFSARRASAGLGEGTPQQDCPQEQNEQRAKFGAVVESCSKLLRTSPIVVFSKLHEASCSPLRSFCKRAQKKHPRFLKNESADICDIQLLGTNVLRLFKLKILFEHFSKHLDFVRLSEYNI